MVYQMKILFMTAENSPMAGQNEGKYPEYASKQVCSV